MKDRTERIEELEAELRNRGASYQVRDDFDDEMRESFLRHVLAFDEEPPTTIRAELTNRGREEPHDLWSLVQSLAELNIVIECTDHLDDHALFDFLLQYLDEAVHVPNDPDTIMHINVIGSGCEEDTEIYLRYYADEEERARWRREFPAQTMPPRERLPYDRDRFLPTAEDLRAALGVDAPILERT